MHLRPAVVLALLDHEVLIGKRSDLRQVSHTQHLLPSAKGFQLLADSIRCTASYANVNLIKDKRAWCWQLLSRFR